MAEGVQNGSVFLENTSGIVAAIGIIGGGILTTVAFLRGALPRKIGVSRSKVEQAKRDKPKPEPPKRSPV